MKKLKDINWNHLYCFYEVAKAQSLKSGARELGVASSTVSAQIKALEKNFDTKLFIRSSLGLKLTKEGDELFKNTRIIFEKGYKLLDHFTEDLVGGYPVTVGIEESISYDLASEFTSQYWDMYTQYGTVNTLRQSDDAVLVENLIQGNIDWGISLRKPKRKSIAYEEIGSFEVVFCCSKELYTKFKSVNDILINIPFVEINSDKNLNDAILEYLRKNSIVPKERIVSDHLDYIQKLCDRGRCVMYLPKNPLEDYKGLKTFQLDEPLKITLYAIWKKKNDGLVSIKILKDLVRTKLSALPKRYEDVDLQIEASDISADLLEE